MATAEMVERKRTGQDAAGLRRRMRAGLDYMMDGHYLMSRVLDDHPAANAHSRRKCMTELEAVSEAYDLLCTAFAQLEDHERHHPRF